MTIEFVELLVFFFFNFACSCLPVVKACSAPNSVVSFAMLLVLPFLNMKVSLALFLIGEYRLFSLYFGN